MISIELRDIRLNAFHGIYEGEQNTGNPYILNLIVKYDDGERNIKEIGSTINYADLYELVKKRMENPEGLLETVCNNVYGDVIEKYPYIKEFDISIYKLQAPIEGLQGMVGVRMTKKVND